MYIDMEKVLKTRVVAGGLGGALATSPGSSTSVAITDSVAMDALINVASAAEFANRLKPLQADSCFIRGTRVHTKDGLKPIEAIKVGDYVLSAPEDGTGKPEYKRVVNVFVHQHKTIRKVNSYGPDAQTQYFVAATGNHPFWVEGKGWTRADELKRGNVLRRLDGSFTEIADQYPVYRTEQDGVGWVQEMKDAETSYGTLFDYENYDLVPRPPKSVYLPREVYESDDPYLKVTVYNLEVEDYQTYYVGTDGIWVRNDNCFGSELSSGYCQLNGM